MAESPDKEKLSLDIGTSANVLLSNGEAYIRSLKVTCTMSFQPQDNYEQIAHKSALFLTKGSHTKQMAPDLSHSWSRVLSKTGHLSDDTPHDQTLARTASIDQSECKMPETLARTASIDQSEYKMPETLAHTAFTDQSEYELINRCQRLAYSIY